MAQGHVDEHPTTTLSLRVGTHVVHPHHGVARVEANELREVGGDKQRYVVLKVDSQSLVILVPAESAGDLGVRPLVTEAEGLEMIQTLARPARMPKSWARRFKNHTEKLRTGDLHQALDVLRNLLVLSELRTLSPAERKMLLGVRDRIVPELVLAFGECRDDVEQRLNDLIAQRSREHDHTT